MKKYYYTIGEVSNLIDVKPHVIRYWESEFNALRPKKSGGRIRKYSEDHILLLKKIKDMLYNQRFTIEGARQKLKQERIAIANIAADAQPNEALAPSPKPTAGSASGPDKALFSTLSSLREDLKNLLSRCKSSSKE